MLFRSLKDAQLKSATITKISSGKYYVSVLFGCENQAAEMKQKRSLGLDFSMCELYRDSNGNEPKYPGYYREAEKKVKREQRKLSKMQRDFLHKQSRKLVDHYEIICIEYLDMKAMAKSLHLGKSVSDNGWGMFTGFLQYKLEEEGKCLVKIDDLITGNRRRKIKNWVDK